MSCPRCGATLYPIEDAKPAFCSHCGLPQLRVSPDAISDSSVPPTGTSVEAGAISWPRALRIIAIAAIAGAGIPALLPGALTGGVVGGLALLLMPALTLVIVFAYCRSQPGCVISPAEGTRMGALLGLLMGSAIAFLTGVAGFVLRYGYHSRSLDERIQQAMVQVVAQVNASGPMPPDLFSFLHSPEFRAGTFVMGHVFSLLLLVMVGSVCGWIAATMLRARRQREQS